MFHMEHLVGGVLMAVAFILNMRARRALEGIADWGVIVRPQWYVCTGVYRLRHPAYIADILGFAGVGILAFGWRGAVLALPGLPFYADRIHREERIRRGTDQQDLQSG